MRHSLLLFVLGWMLFVAWSPSAQGQEKKTAETPIWSDQKDRFGDPLPQGAIARIGTTRYRLPNGAGASALSPDGKLLAVLRNQSEIEIWELPAWTRSRIINSRNIGLSEGPEFRGLAFSADSKKLLTFDAINQQAYLFDLATGKSIKAISLLEKKRVAEPHLMLSRDEQTVVFMHHDHIKLNGCLVWDLAKDRLVKSLNIPTNLPEGRLYKAVSADCRRLALSTPEDFRVGIAPSIEFWDLKTGKLDRKIETEDVMRMLAFSPDGKWLAASSGESMLRIYEVATGKEKHNIRLPHDTVNHLEFSPDSVSLYVVNYLGQMTRWNPVNGEQTATFKSPNGYVRRHLSFQSDGKVLALRIFMRGVHFWEATSGKSLSPTGVPTGVHDVTFSPKGDLFVSSDMLAWWNPRTGARLRDLRLDLSAFGSLADRLSIRGEVLYAQPHASSVTMSQTGEFLVNADGGSGRSINFYDAKTGKLLYDEDGGPGGRLRWVCFFDADRKVASILQNKVRIWNARTGRDVSHFTVHLRNQEHAIKMSVSPNGKHFAFRTDGDDGIQRALLWDVEKQKIVREWPAPTRAGTMKFSPDNQWLANDGGQQHLRLTRVRSARGDTLLPTGNTDPSLRSQIAFSPDGRQLAVANVTGVDDKAMGRVVIYELASKKIRLALVGHSEVGDTGGFIGCLAYARDSGLLATGSNDTTVLVWRAGLRAFAEKGADKDATDGDLADWFQQMAGTDAKTAYQNMIKLAQTPKQTVKLFEEKSPPAKKPDTGEKTVPQWIQDLGSGQFAIRGKASAMLQKIGPSVEPELRAALPKANDVETKRRIEELLEHLAAYEWTAEEVLHARAVEVLDAIGTPEAGALLTRWASGDPAAVLTVEARRALAEPNKK
jgi:WD40 repeat protein